MVLSVFRDFSYPLGVGSFDRFAIPRRAYVTRVTALADRLEVQADVERVEKFLRDWRLVREPLAPLPTSGDRPEIPVCRYVVIGAGGEVVAAGSTAEVVKAAWSISARPTQAGRVHGAARAGARRQLGESRGDGDEVSG